MLLANAAKRFVPPHELYHFYRKELPLLGGISNVNLNNTWAAEYHPAPVLEYLRISPTGPMVPLVFNLTTLGDRLHLSMTYREVLLDEAMAARWPTRSSNASRPEGVASCGLLDTCYSRRDRRQTRCSPAEIATSVK